MNLDQYKTALPFAAMISCAIFATSSIATADPFASNNGILPTPQEWSGRYLAANLDYPENPSDNHWVIGTSGGPLTQETAPDYANRILDHLKPDLEILINDPNSWDPVETGWYDLVWSGGGSAGANNQTDPTSGRDSIMNTYSGQIIPKNTYSPPNHPQSDVQNHAVIYYNSTAATMLGRLFNNVYDPDLSQATFPEGSVVIKVEAVTNSAQDWNLIENAATWKVYRPETKDLVAARTDPSVKIVPKVIDAHPFQFVARIKDSIASPQTGWVFALFVYDKNADGATPFDRFRPIGLQWGNDPEFNRLPAGVPENGSLKETWVNPQAPDFIKDTMGWGGRLSGPMDLAARHDVVTVSGKTFQDFSVPGHPALKASSCQSCHSTAQFPFARNLYPSPNSPFPADGTRFLMYDPGSKEWAEWFENRPGTVPLSKRIGGHSIDYDMALTFAIATFNAEAGNNAYVIENPIGH